MQGQLLKNWNVHVEKDLIYLYDVKETKLQQLFVQLAKTGYLIITQWKWNKATF